MCVCLRVWDMSAFHLDQKSNSRIKIFQARCNALQPIGSLRIVTEVMFHHHLFPSSHLDEPSIKEEREEGFGGGGMM